MEQNYFRLMQIEAEIKKAEEKKSTGTVLMIVSIFFLWPLFIVGIIFYCNGNNKVKALQNEKQNIVFQEMLNSQKKTEGDK